MDKCREQFEEWAKSIPPANLKRHLDGYGNQTINSHWATWQSSRQALVVDVESLPSASYIDGGVVYRSHVESMIESAGVSLK